MIETQRTNKMNAAGVREACAPPITDFSGEYEH